MNNSSVTRDGREKLERFLFKVPELHMGKNHTIWKWNSISLKKFMVNAKVTTKIIFKEG